MNGFARRSNNRKSTAVLISKKGLKINGTADVNLDIPRMIVEIWFNASVITTVKPNNYTKKVNQFPDTRNKLHIYYYQLRSIVMSASVCVCVCVCVCRSSSGGVKQPQGKGAILGVFFSIDNALHGPYSGMNFATKDRLRLNFLLYCKVGRIQFTIIKRHNCDCVQITRKLN